MRYSALGFGPVNRYALLLLNKQAVAKAVFESRMSGRPLACSETVSQTMHRIGVLSPSGELSPSVHVVRAKDVDVLEELVRPQLDTYRDRALGILRRHQSDHILGDYVAEYRRRGFNFCPIVFMAFLADMWVNEVVLREAGRPYLERGELILTDYVEECASYEWYGIRQEALGDLTTVFLWDLTEAKASDLLVIISGRGIAGLQTDGRFFLVDDRGLRVLERVRCESNQLAEPLMLALQRSELNGIPGSSLVVPRLFMKEMAACLMSEGMIWSPWSRMAVLPSSTQV